MAKTEKEIVKVSKKNGSKEFFNRFHFIGQVKPVQQKEEGADTWIDVPYFEKKQTKTKPPKPRQVLQFQLETSKSNNLKVEVAGMEQDSVYPYSMTDRKGCVVPWEDRLDKSKFPNETYHIINGTDWDRAELIGGQIQTGQWVEVKGYYDFSTFKDDEDKDVVSRKRTIEQFKIIEDGASILLGKVDNKEIRVTYVTDFDSPDFVEVNSFTMQIGIRSTYQKEEKQDTLVNGMFLKSAKVRSEPQDVQLTVYYKEPTEGSTGKPLADAFKSLKKLDFIEVTGVDNNRATFSYVDVVDKLEDDDPFNEVDDSERSVRQERVVTGDKKGLEITGYTSGRLLRGFLKEDDYAKTGASETGNPFTPAQEEKDPFADDDSEDLPFE